MYLKIVRNTNGWRDENGYPKQRDWISHSQFSKVGVSSRSVTSAIEELLSHNLIILTDDNGNLLHNPQQRKRANRIYYALTTNDKVKTTDTTERNHKTKPQNLLSTKENSSPKYKANERMPDHIRIRQILMDEQLKQNQRDSWNI
ncbi:MAG: hypothetical protein EVB11_13135 [Winogradskyella sp.]|nr:MAG: hypothetical protein EVB11_13135 [Winogradskyella sp.]